MSDETNSNINIKSLEPTHRGVYKITAENVAGVAEAEFKVNVLGEWNQQ